MRHAQVTDLAASNAEQARSWDGEQGRFWARHADELDASLQGYHRTYIEAAAFERYDVVLDVGCGAGQTSRDAARLSASGTVLGVDLSTPLLEIARQRAAEEQLTNISYLRADAQVYPFEPQSFDVVISRAGTMFFGEPAVAFANLAGALRPEGRLVMLVWQGREQNEWFRCLFDALAVGRDLPIPPTGAPGPFALSDPDRVRQLLVGAGFTEPELRDLRAPMYFGETPDRAVEFVLGLHAWMLEGLDDDGRDRAQEALRSTVAEHETADGVTFGSAMWLVTATRAQPRVVPQLPLQRGSATDPHLPRQR
jgi:SAM-dependent methyltransferase